MSYLRVDQQTLPHFSPHSLRQVIEITATSYCCLLTFSSSRLEEPQPKARIY